MVGSGQRTGSGARHQVLVRAGPGLVCGEGSCTGKTPSSWGRHIPQLPGAAGSCSLGTEADMIRLR